MTANLGFYIGIERACLHWSDAPMLQQTFDALKRELDAENDAVVDCSKGLLECVCRLIVDEMDGPSDPIRPLSSTPSLGEWLSAAVRGLGLGEIRNEAFRALISQHHKLADKLNNARNSSGPVSHGKDAYLLALSQHQRKSIVLATDCIVIFLFEAFRESLERVNLERTKEPFDRFEEWNATIDKYSAVSEAEVTEDGAVSLTFKLVNDDEFTYVATVSELMFHLDRSMYISAKNASLSAKGSNGPDSIEEEAIESSDIITDAIPEDSTIVRGSDD